MNDNIDQVRNYLNKLQLEITAGLQVADDHVGRNLADH